MLVAVSIAGTAACASENESPYREFETAYNAEVSGTAPGQSGDVRNADVVSQPQCFKCCEGCHG